MLAPKEIYINWSDRYDTSKYLTRTLDYYTSIGVTTSNYSGAIKKNGTSASAWWLRVANSIGNDTFYDVYSDGDWFRNGANYTYGVSPAFRLG